MEIARDRSDSILDLCISAILEKGQSVEACLAAYPEERTDLAPLLTLAARLQVTHSMQASHQFKASAERRLRRLAQVQPSRAMTGDPAIKTLPRKANPILPKFFPRWRLLATSLILVVLIISSIGTIAASAQSLPGDFLYPVKRTQENIQMTFTPDTAGQARLHLEFANRRFDEALLLLEENRPLALGPVLAEYNNQMQAELAYLDEKSTLTPNEQSGLANTLLADATSRQANLTSLTKGAPPSAQENVQLALTTTQKAYNRAAEIIQNKQSSPTQPPYPSPTAPLPTRTPVPTNLPPSQTPVPTQPAARIFPFNNTLIHTPTQSPQRTSPGTNATPLPQASPTPRPKPTIRTNPPLRSPPPTLRPTPRPWAVPLLKSRTPASAG